MAIQHQLDYTTDPAATICSIHPTDSTDHVTEQAKTTTRIVNAVVGGLNWCKCTTQPGDTNVAFSGTHLRADTIYGSTRTLSTVNSVRVYRQRLLVRPGVDWNPISAVFNTCGWGFHRQAGGYPGGVFWTTRMGTSSNTSGKNDDTWNNDRITSATSTKPRQVGNLIMEFFGGKWADANRNAIAKDNNNPGCHWLNAEQWVLFDSTWEGKAVDVAWRIKWSANINEWGAKFYKDYNGGAPTLPEESGWIEIQYRIGTVGANSVTWGAWNWYNPADIVFTDGKRQVWQNGSELYRHYRPTLFWYLIDSSYDNPYWKPGHNYHDDNGQINSVYVGNNTIADSFSDLGLVDPSGNGASNALPALPPGKVRFGTYNTSDNTPPTSRGSLGADRVRASGPVELTTGIDVSKIYVFTEAPSAGTQVYKVAVWDDDGTGGEPGTRLLLSSEVSKSGVQTGDWDVITVSPAVSLSAGFVWLGLHSGGTAGVLNYAYQDIATSYRSVADTYADGSPSTFPGGSTSDRYKMGIVLEGTATGGSSGGGSDVTAPSLEFAYTTNSSRVTLDYDEEIDTVTPDTVDYVIKVNGITQTTLAVNLELPDRVVVTHSANAVGTDIITISYTAGTNKIQDMSGNFAANLTNQAVDNLLAPPGNEGQPGRIDNPAERLNNPAGRLNNPAGRIAGIGGGG